jgi:hypothetical protein
VSDESDEEPDNALYADHRNFYKVEKWKKDGMKVDRLLYAGNSLEKARELFDDAVEHWPRIRLTGRQRTRVPAAVTCLRLVGPLRLIRRVRSDTRLFQEFRGGSVRFF